MTHYAENPGMVRVDRFRTTPGRKWYDTYAVNMGRYYNLPDIYEAVARAWVDRYTWSGSGQPPLGGEFVLVCLEPYHQNSFPVMLTQATFCRYSLTTKGPDNDS